MTLAVTQRYADAGQMLTLNPIPVGANSKPDSGAAATKPREDAQLFDAFSLDRNTGRVQLLVSKGVADKWACPGAYVCVCARSCLRCAYICVCVRLGTCICVCARSRLRSYTLASPLSIGVCSCSRLHSYTHAIIGLRARMQGRDEGTFCAEADSSSPAWLSAIPLRSFPTFPIMCVDVLFLRCAHRLWVHRGRRPPSRT